MPAAMPVRVAASRIFFTSLLSDMIYLKDYFFNSPASIAQMSPINQVILVVILMFLAIFTDCFKIISFLFSRNDMPGKFESLFCVFGPDEKYSTDGGDF